MTLSAFFSASGSQGGYSLCSAGGHSHARAKGRYLWRKDASPLDPHQKHGGRHRPPYPLWAQRPGAPAPAFGIQPPGVGRGARRHELLCKPGTHLPAAPVGIPCGTAFPHLKPGHSPGYKPERLSATSPCVPLRYALPGVLSIELQRDAPCYSFRCRWKKEKGGRVPSFKNTARRYG